MIRFSTIYAALVQSRLYHYQLVRPVKAWGDDPPSIACRSAGLTAVTGNFGDTDANGLVNVTDIVNTVDVVKNVSGALSERQVYVRQSEPLPHLESTNVTDIVKHVAAVKLFS